MIHVGAKVVDYIFRTRIQAGDAKGHVEGNRKDEEDAKEESRTKDFHKIQNTM